MAFKGKMAVEETNIERKSEINHKKLHFIQHFSKKKSKFNKKSTEFLILQIQISKVSFYQLVSKL